MTDSKKMEPSTLSFHHDFPGSSLHRFSHRAMATLFEILCAHPDREYARQAALAAFDLVDRIEQELSRFIPNSDISRISRLRATGRVRVTAWTMECLQISKVAFEETYGAFDVSLGSGLNDLELVPGESVVSAKADGIHIDLGGIGKGFAVDKVSEVMLDWEIHQCLIHGGFSSVLVLDPPSGSEGWPLTMSFPNGGRAFASILSKNRVFSASGVRKGGHIVDPQTGRPARLRSAAWVSGDRDVLAGFCRGSEDIEGLEEPTASAAAVAEAFSTAFMVLGTPEIRQCCKQHPGLEVWLLPQETDVIVKFP